MSNDPSCMVGTIRLKSTIVKNTVNESARFRFQEQWKLAFNHPTVAKEPKKRHLKRDLTITAQIHGFIVVFITWCRQANSLAGRHSTIHNKVLRAQPVRMTLEHQSLGPTGKGSHCQRPQESRPHRPRYCLDSLHTYHRNRQSRSHPRGYLYGTLIPGTARSL